MTPLDLDAIRARANAATETPCVYCRGECCRDFTHKRFPHKAAEHYWHACAYCADGAKPTVWTAEQERAAVVAYVRSEANKPHPTEAGERALSPSGRGLLLLHADRIERGEHRREEEE